MKTIINFLSKIIFITILCCLGYNAQAQINPGALDITYNDSGKVIYELPSVTGSLRGFCSALDATDRLLVGGYAYLTFNGGKRYAMVARFKTDGRIDSSFGTAGFFVDTSRIGRFDAITVAADGKILVAGNTPIPATFGTDITVYRLNTNGTPDATFATIGNLKINFGTLFYHSANDIHEQADGNILVNADFTVTINDENKLGFCRLLPTGTLDNSFGTGGLSTHSLGVFSARSFKSRLDANGKHLVAGYTNPTQGMYNPSAVLTRYNTNGSLDGSFGSGGIASLHIQPDEFVFQGVDIATDGNIYACGTWTDSVTTDWDFVVAKYSSAGVLDPSFGNGGKLRIDFFGDDDEAHDLAIQTDGKLIITGQVRNTNNVWEFGTLRLMPNGKIDSSFGINGIAHFTVGSGDAYPAAIEIQSDGKIVLAGFSGDGGIAIARLLNDASLGILNNEKNKLQTLLYPNPVQNTAVLEYELAKASIVNVEIRLIDGKLVKKIENKTRQTIGKHSLEIDLSDMAAGTYFVNIVTEDGVTSVQVMKQ